MVKQYLLDTNVLIAMFKGQHGIQEKMVAVGLQNCFVSEITLAELYAGAYKSMRKDALRQVVFVRNNLGIIPFDCAEVYGKLRSHLETAGNRLDDMDLLIASTALDHGLTLVTNNTRHFSRAIGLEIEDWFE